MINTRIAKLKRNKRVRKVSKVVAIGLLVCPLTLGAINALADTENTEPATEEVAPVEETLATTEETALVEETKISELSQPEIVEESQPVPEQQQIEKIEAETIQPFDNSQADITQEIMPQKNLINSWYSIEGPDIIESGETASYRFFFYEVYDDGTSTEEELTLDEMGAQLTSSDPSDVISGNTITFSNAGTRIISVGSGALMVEVTDENHTLYRVREVFEDGSPLLGGSPTSDRRYATAGEEVTEVAQEIPGCSVIGETTQTKIIASDGSTVFTFVYRNNADKTKLEQAINEAEAKLSEGGWKDTTELETILETAKQVLTSNYAPQETIDSLATSLTTALSALEKEEAGTPTTTKLESSIQEAEAKLTESGYTAESIKALEQALQNAKDVLANINSTQAEIDKAQTALELAIANLVKEDSSNGTDNSNNQNGNTNNSSSTNQDENNNNSSNPSDPNNTNSNTNKVNNKTATNNNTKDTTNLPQTGDTPTNMLISGLSMLGASLITILVRRRKKA